MGLTQSITKPFRCVRHHTVKQTLEIIKRYCVSNYDAGLAPPELAELLNPDEKDIEDASKMCRALTGNPHGHAPVLTLLAGLLCISKGKQSETTSPAKGGGKNGSQGRGRGRGKGRGRRGRA